MIIILQSTKIVQHLMDENKVTRNHLQALVQRCIKFVQRMPETRLGDLLAVYPNAKGDLGIIEEELYVNECVILVAGKCY